MENRQRHYFHPVDYVLLVVSLGVSLGVGIYQAVKGGKQKTTSEYLMGGRQFKILPVALSLIASFISSIGLIGLPAEVHFYGVHTMFSFVGLIFSVLLSALVFVPLFHPLGITSVNQYLEMRYKSRTVRLFGTVIYLISQLFYTGCVVYGQAVALEAATSLPYWASILLVIVLGTIYTAFGGMKAVIWTDVFQVTVMFVSMLSVIIIGMVKVGGPGITSSLNKEWGRFYINWDLGIYARMTFWSASLASMVGWVTAYSVNQTAVQRYCSVPTVSKARGSMVINAFGAAIFCTVCCVVGMVTFAFYSNLQCDPYADGDIPNKNQILPLFIMDVLSYPGLPGLFVSGLFCGSLSTISSNINSMCAVIWEDLFKPYIGHKLSAERQVIINQLIEKADFCHNVTHAKLYRVGLCLASASTVGLVGLGMAFLVHNVGGSLLQIASALHGLCAGPSLGVFVLGAIVPWSNWLGALSGGVASLTVVFWIFIGQMFLGNLSVALPLPTSGCHANSTFNDTLMTQTSTIVSYLSTMESTTVIPNGPERSFLDDWLYSISFMWYGVIGFTMCLLVGIAVSFLTGRTDPSTVEKRLYFGFVAKYYGKESEEHQNADPKTMSPLMSLNEKKELESSL